MRRVDALRLLIATSAPHRRALFYGTVATMGVVAMRLSLPWPLRGLVENVFPPAGDAPALGAAIGIEDNQVLVFCGLYFLLAVGTGIFEWIQRVWMARVASHTAHDLRGAAVAAVSRGTTGANVERADLITRIIGDSARVKADLKGILIHLTQNVLLLLAITALFLYLAPRLGLLFLASGLLAVLIGYVTVEEVAETTQRQRRKESKYAAAIPIESVDDPAEGSRRSLDRSSAKKEVRITRIIGRSTLAIHAAVAATLGLAFWVGVQDVRTGSLAPGELFLFIAYAITIQRRAVMIGRQVARGGKLLANAQRIGMLAETSAAAAGPSTLETSVRLDGLRLKASRAHARRSRLGPLDLTIPRGQRMLVLGGDGSGKSSLLRVLAGRAPADRGRLLWDGQEIGEGVEAARRVVAYLPAEIEFGAATVRGLLGLAGQGEPSSANVATLEAIGAWKVIRGLRGGLDQTVASGELSPRQRRALLLGGILLGDAAVWVLDEPVAGVSAADRRRLALVLERAGERTVIVSLRRPLLVERFDRVVALRKGKLDFDGTPANWEARRAQMRAVRRA